MCICRCKDKYVYIYIFMFLFALVFQPPAILICLVEPWTTKPWECLHPLMLTTPNKPREAAAWNTFGFLSADWWLDFQYFLLSWNSMENDREGGGFFVHWEKRNKGRFWFSIPTFTKPTEGLEAKNSDLPRKKEARSSNNNKHQGLP